MARQKIPGVKNSHLQQLSAPRMSRNSLWLIRMAVQNVASTNIFKSRKVTGGSDLGVCILLYPTCNDTLAYGVI